MRRAMLAPLVVLAFASIASAQLMRFDFGSAASPLEPGYTLVTPESVYADAAGFGWKTGLRVVPAADKWWNPQEKGGILSAFDTKTGSALATDYCFGFHFFGWPHTAEDKDGVNRLGIVMDDDLKTEFVVRVKPGRYSVLVGMGDIATSHRIRPMNAEVNGVPLARNLSLQTVTYKRADAVDCPDGVLTVTFRGEPGYKHPYP